MTHCFVLVKPNRHGISGRFHSQDEAEKFNLTRFEGAGFVIPCERLSEIEAKEES